MTIVMGVGGHGHCCLPEEMTSATAGRVVNRLNWCLKTEIDDTYFVWIGDGNTSTGDFPVFYYRIYNPSVWIEYNVESNAGPGVEAGNHTQFDYALRSVVVDDHGHTHND